MMGRGVTRRTAQCRTSSSPRTPRSPTRRRMRREPGRRRLTRRLRDGGTRYESRVRQWSPRSRSRARVLPAVEARIGPPVETRLRPAVETRLGPPVGTKVGPGREGGRRKRPAMRPTMLSGRVPGASLKPQISEKLCQ